MTAPWATYPDLPAPLPALPGGEEEWAEVIAYASAVLWALTGRRWAGQRTRNVTVTAPVTGEAHPVGWDLSWGLVHPVLIGGEVYNCGCRTSTRVRLPDDAVTDVEEVRVGGTLRNPTSYWLDRGYLVDTAGHGWPTCPPGFTVRYRHGRRPPPAGRRAAALYARELGRARAGDPASPLLLNLTSRTRQAVTETFVPAADLIAKGQTGVPQVDSWVATVNPAKLTRRARAWSPDTHPPLTRRTQ